MLVCSEHCLIRADLLSLLLSGTPAFPRVNYILCMWKLPVCFGFEIISF